MDLPNITIELVETPGLLPFYRITPNEGYVLHDKTLDYDEFDELGYPTGNRLLGCYPSGRTCHANYDFENTKEIDGHTAYGAREFFACPISETGGVTE